MKAFLPPIKRIQRSDVPGADPWVDGLLDPLNRVLDFLYRFCDGGISLQGNVASASKAFEVRTQSDYDDGEFDIIKFDTDLGRITECRIVQCIDLDDENGVLSGPISCVGGWRGDGGEVQIRWICGLEASRRYLITFYVF